MKKRATEIGRRMLPVLLVGSLLAMWAGALPVAADTPPNPVRILPATVAPGEEFEVTVTVTAPCDHYSPAFVDTPPAGWSVSVEETWCTPRADWSGTEDGNANYEWNGEGYGVDTLFTGVYKVHVPADAQPGEYMFSGVFGGWCDNETQPQEAIGGDSHVTILPPTSGEVGLRARTPPATGSMKLIKLFVPDEAEYPHDEIAVQVTGPDDFDETYTLTRGESWEKTIPGLEVGTYSVQELTVVPGWIPSYSPEGRQLTVVAGTEPGPDATMTITNTYSVIGISVSPSEINWEVVTPGVIHFGAHITVTNTGTLNIDVSAELTADTKYDVDSYFYTRALQLNNEFSDRHSTPTEFGAWTAMDLGLVNMAPADSPEVTTAVDCPSEMFADTEYTGTLVFWAVESGG
ncbi:MAG: DUF5979 domain-containing protein [Dehalococcoidia bacterium]